MATKLDALTKKRDQIEAQIKAIKEKENAQARKYDTRRKVLLGGIIMKMVKTGDWTQEKLTSFVDKHLEADRDRVLFGLAPKIDQESEPGSTTG